MTSFCDTAAEKNAKKPLKKAPKEECSPSVSEGCKQMKDLAAVS